MQDEQRKKLDDLLSKYENKQSELRQQKDKVEQHKNSFLEQFEVISNDRIKPVMDEIGQILKSKGHDYAVLYSKESKSERGATIEPRITMEIYPNGNGKTTYSNKAAHIMFFAEKSEIGVHENTLIPNGGGGHAGTKPTKYNLDTLTVDKIEKEIVQSIDKILNREF
jgi:hypothetical protein